MTATFDVPGFTYEGPGSVRFELLTREGGEGGSDPMPPLNDFPLRRDSSAREVWDPVELPGEVHLDPSNLYEIQFVIAVDEPMSREDVAVLRVERVGYELDGEEFAIPVASRALVVAGEQFGANADPSVCDRPEFEALTR